MAEARPRIEVDPSQLRDLFADLKTLEDGKTRKRALVRRLKSAGDPVKRQVIANAAAIPSTRIPQAVGMKVQSTGKRVGVLVTISRKKAPHARPLDNAGRAGTFTHPLFGNPRVQVRQQARPFAFNGLAQHFPDVERAVLAAIDDAARDAGFHDR